MSSSNMDILRRRPPLLSPWKEATIIRVKFLILTSTIFFCQNWYFFLLFSLMCLSGALTAEFIPLVRSDYPSRMAYIIEEGRGKCSRYLFLKFTPGCFQRHCFQFNHTTLRLSICRLCMAGGWFVLETIFWRAFTLCMWPDAEPTEFIAHLETKT